MTGRVGSSIWTGAGEVAKNCDTPAGGGVERSRMSGERGTRKFFAPGCRFRPVAYRQWIAFGKLPTDGDFRGKQTTEKAGRPINQIIETGRNVVSEPFELVVQASEKFCCDDIRAVFPTCHGKTRSLFRA
ncbi:MAG TPA: hypothetical protein VN048_10085 [Verrucomicrobiae bacterium]|nr:hypothetical protein [Verrucomicrobiae bacterium]